MTRGRLALVVLAGAALAVLAYPPFRIPAASFVMIVPAVALVREAESRRSARTAFRWGLLYGFVTQGAVLYWLVVALWHFTPLSALGYLATIAVLGLWTGAAFAFVVWVRTRLPRVPLALVLPTAWTVMEWIVGHQGDVAFPWLGLGTSLADAPVLIQWADLAGARGVGWWVGWCNVMVAGVLLDWGEARARAALRGGAVLASIVLAGIYGLWRMRTLPLRGAGVVALIQPNIPYNEKWNAAEADREVDLLLALSRRARDLGRPDLVVWPEAALPGYLFEQGNWDSLLTRFTRESRTPLLTGGLHATLGPDRTVEIFNAAFFFDSTGDWRDHPVYEKRDLVPMVERTPFVPARWLRGVPGLRNWAGRFSRGTTLPLYQAAPGRFGVIICYESAFEALARHYRAEGADFLVNITNDAWYGRTAGPYQHATHLVLRAIETRMGIARAANDGISEFVDPLGRVTDATGLEREAVVVDRLRTSDVVPLYVRLGDWVGVLALAVTAVLAAAALRLGPRAR